MLPVIRTPRAALDVIEILERMERRSSSAARRLEQSLRQRFELLGKVPGMGRSRDDLHPGMKSVVVDRYVIFFRVTDVAVEILRVLHGARDLEAIFRDDPPDND